MMRHVYTFAARVMSVTAFLLLVTALMVGFSQGTLADDCGIVTNCSSSACAICNEDDKGNCGKSGEEVTNKSCQSGNDCSGCTCSKSAAKECDCYDP